MLSSPNIAEESIGSRRSLAFLRWILVTTNQNERLSSDLRAFSSSFSSEVS